MTTLKSIPWCLSVLILLSAGATARADGGSGVTAATGQRSLATKVGDGQNQTLGGSCNSGHCRISGGTSRGGNLFHRLSKLRTNSNINKIKAFDIKIIFQQCICSKLIFLQLELINQKVIYNGPYISRD